MARKATKLIAVYPGGREFELRHRNGAWYWDNGKASFPLSAAIDNVKEVGGRVERRPTYAGQSLARFMGDWLR
jgi:hypothetical protein